MEKVKITKLFRTKVDKSGNPLKTKDGREYERVGFKVERYGDKWISIFGNKVTDGWVVGQEVEVEITQNGEYLNAKLPARNVTREEYDALVARIAKLESLISMGSADKPEEDEIPF